MKKFLQQVSNIDLQKKQKRNASLIPSRHSSLALAPFQEKNPGNFSNERLPVRQNSESALVKAKGSKRVCISNFELSYNYFDIFLGF